ncbi:MAG TPA: histidine kinase [Burkholderiaceae bacterium]|nr:histidine kinase [Burkholderiaceae bacterium]
MHPIFSDSSRLSWYVATWLLIGSLIAWLLIAADVAPWANALFFAIPVSLLFGFVAMSAYYVCRALPLARRRLPRLVLTFGATSMISGALLLVICLAWTKLTSSLDLGLNGFQISQHGQVAVVGLGFGLYLLSILAHDVLIAFENLRSAERRENESHILAREAELQMLRTQVNPHFLFNSLNSISALTTIDAAAARQMTIALAQFFRQTLAQASMEKITLARELALCESFLTVEKIRFGKKLEAVIDADQQALRGLIPPMILQPLLENAIKHGIHGITEGGVITVTIMLRDAWLHIVVENPMEPGTPTAPGNGIGLQNIQRRCTNLYDERARIAWRRSDDNRFVVEMTIPFELET